MTDMAAATNVNARRQSAKARKRRLPSLHGNPVLTAIFFLGVFTIAGFGNATAAISWLGWTPMFAVPAVVFAEITGAYTASMADERMRLGERAVAARVLSGAIACGIVALNWFGHADRNIIQAGFFAAASAVGYIGWLIRTGNRRRDELRAKGMMTRNPPVYGFFQWWSDPKLTAVAKRIYVDDETQDRASSLESARLQIALAGLVRQEIMAANQGNPVVAEALVAIYDPNSMAASVRERVKWDEVADQLAERISPRRVFAGNVVPTNRGSRGPGRSGVRKAGGRVVVAPPRRSPEETKALYLSLEAANPGQTQTWYADQLQITSRRLREVLNGPSGGHALVPTNGNTPH